MCVCVCNKLVLCVLIFYGKYLFQVGEIEIHLFYKQQ